MSLRKRKATLDQGEGCTEATPLTCASCPSAPWQSEPRTAYAHQIAGGSANTVRKRTDILNVRNVSAAIPLIIST